MVRWLLAVLLSSGCAFGLSGPDPNRPAPAAEKRIEELEALVGRLTLENRFFKGALQRIEDLPRASGGNGAKLSLPRSKP